MSKPFCLVVDDDDDCREISEILCRSLGMEVQGVSDGQEALSICVHHLPELILLDWMMPRMDGIEFLNALQVIQGGDKVSVLMCSARIEEEDKKRAIKAGAVGYLTKPFNPPELMQNILGTPLFEKLKDNPDFIN